MQKMNTILKQFRDIAINPRKIMEDYRTETGRDAIGIMPLYSPEGLVHTTGCLPMELWGANRPVTKAHVYLSALACFIMRQVMEPKCEGAYNGLAAVVLFVPCDALKCMNQKWKGKLPVLVPTHPQNRGLEPANRFLEQEYLILKEKLEKITGVQITNAALENSIHIYNESRAAMHEFSQLTAQYPQLIFAVDHYTVPRSRMFVEKSHRAAMVRSPIDTLKAIEPQPWDSKKIILTGILAESGGLLEIFDQLKLAVTADDLTQESRRIHADVSEGNGVPLYRLARVWQNICECSLTVDTKRRRGPMLVDMVHRNGADAVVVVVMKFCDPEGWGYPICRRQFGEVDILHLIIEVDQKATAFEQAQTRLQSFAEIL